MVAIVRDKMNYHKVFKYANVLIFKEFYPKTKNVLYYLNWYYTHISPQVLHYEVFYKATCIMPLVP